MQNGADVNIMDKRRSTPLHRAASKGDINIVSLLLTLGTNLDINIADVYKNTALHLACQENNAEVAELLINKGALINLKNQEEKTPLELASVEVQKILNKVIENKGI